MDNDELERILSLEESALNRTTEINRVLQCNPFDYFDILQINPIPVQELSSVIKRIYRKKSLLIHPDKTDHPRASKAFDLLKKAEKVVSCVNEQEEEYKEKNRLISIYKTVTESESESDLLLIKKKVSEILQDEISQQELSVLYQQTAKQWKHDQQQKLKQERELKKKLDNQWEDERDVRVKNWRNYSNKITKKKKKSNKPKVLV